MDAVDLTPMIQGFRIWEQFLLSVLALAFLAWAGVVWRSSRSISEKLDALRKEYHTRSISTEHRITNLEAMMNQIILAMKIKKASRFNSNR